MTIDKNSSAASMPAVDRHMGMDWLRIGAFAILILYHSALYFGPHPWVMRSERIYEWLAFPLAAVSPWRLLVLFAVSGFASAAMIGRSPGIGTFYRERSLRLLLPLLFGVVVLVPPQAWAQAVVENAYSAGLGRFWLTEYFRFGAFHGHTLPHLQHLWFLAYLWGYTTLFVCFTMAVPHWRAWLSSLADVMAPGRRILVFPILILMTLRVVLREFGLEMTGMFDDWVGDFHYIPAFLFGLMLALFPQLWASVQRNWSAALFGASVAYLAIAACLVAFPNQAQEPKWATALGAMADSFMAWSVLIVMLHLANTILLRDHPARATLAKMIFPAYLVHQTVIVIVGFMLLQFALPGYFAFPIIVASVVLASVAAYQLALWVPWIGPVLGVFGKPKHRKTSKSRPELI